MASLDPKKRPSAAQQLKLLDLAEEGGAYDFGAGPDDGGDDMGAGLEGQFSNLNIQDDSGIGYEPDSTDSVPSPERAYYEPYTTGILDSTFEEEGGPSREYPWGEEDETAPGQMYQAQPWRDEGAAGPSHRYMPPAKGGKNVPREHHQVTSQRIYTRTCD